jgi:hypothetical protein
MNRRYRREISSWKGTSLDLDPRQCQGSRCGYDLNGFTRGSDFSASLSLKVSTGPKIAAFSSLILQWRYHA